MSRIPIVPGVWNPKRDGGPKRRIVPYPKRLRVEAKVEREYETVLHGQKVRVRRYGKPEIVVPEP